MIQEAINRIEQMETYFDALQEAVKIDPELLIANPRLKCYLQNLVLYYEGGQWLQDYELDEMGILPKNLKRGVLAQDAVYDFLEQIKHVNDIS